MAYQKFGSGPLPAFCFHGFGESADTWQALEPYLQTHTLIAVDMPYHGATRWVGPIHFSPEDLYAITQLILQQEGFAAGVQYLLAGYSMGARIALAMYQYSPQRVSRLILLAPDGVQKSVWYHTATATNWGNNIFKKTMQKPAAFLQMVNKLEAWRFLNKGLAKFVRLNLAHAQSRELLYSVWTAFASFKPQLGTIATHVKTMQTPVYLIYGKYDRLMPLSSAKKLQHLLAPHAALLTIDAGHQLLNNKYAAEIVTFTAL